MAVLRPVQVCVGVRGDLNPWCFHVSPLYSIIITATAAPYRTTPTEHTADRSAAAVAPLGVPAPSRITPPPLEHDLSLISRWHRPRHSLAKQGRPSHFDVNNRNGEDNADNKDDLFVNEDLLTWTYGHMCEVSVLYVWKSQSTDKKPTTKAGAQIPKRESETSTETHKETIDRYKTKGPQQKLGYNLPIWFTEHHFLTASSKFKLCFGQTIRSDVKISCMKMVKGVRNVHKYSNKTYYCHTLEK